MICSKCGCRVEPGMKKCPVCGSILDNEYTRYEKKMKKKRIVYSLTGRGLFSELSNLALALVYADYNQEELTVNSFFFFVFC